MEEFNPFITRPHYYLDWLSHEYGTIDNDTRLLHMAVFVHRGGNLQRFINRYRAAHSPNWSDAIFDTLLRNLVYLRTGDAEHLLGYLKDHLNEEQLIRLFEAELRANYNGNLLPNKIGEFQRRTVAEYDLSKYKTDEQRIYGELIGKIDIFTETAEHLRDSNPWLYVAWLLEENDYTMPDPYMGVHPLDESAFKRINEYWDEKAQKGKTEELQSELYRLRLGMPPDCTQGDPLTADVVILMLNPGYDKDKSNLDVFKELTEDEQRDYIKSRCENMSFRDKICVHNGDTPLDKIINSVNGGYWARVLDPVLKEAPEARSKIAVVNLMGYQSMKYHAVPKRLFGDDSTAPDRNILAKQTDITPPPLFHTQYYTLRLVRWLMNQGKLFVMGHGSANWYKLIPALAEYPNKVSRNGINMTISPKNCKDDGWEKIIAALQGKAQKPKTVEAVKPKSYGPKSGKTVGDIHPNGKWVWKEYAPGKFDWRVIKTLK